MEEQIEKQTAMIERIYFKLRVLQERLPMTAEVNQVAFAMKEVDGMVKELQTFTGRVGVALPRRDRKIV